MREKPRPGVWYSGPPPGYVTAQGVAAVLGLSPQRAYAAGLLELLDSWQGGEGNPRYFREADAALLRDWLQFAVPGMRALGLWKATAPRIPAGGMAAIREWFAADDYGADCPVCGGPALTNYGDPDGSVWCPVDGLLADASASGRSEHGDDLGAAPLARTNPQT
jgi:hypothetical protein